MFLKKPFSFLYLLLALCLFSSYAVEQRQTVTVCSWNIRDFGQTKNEEEIDFIAKTVKDFDVVAIQEVVAGYGGAQAVARLHQALNRKGAQWNYVVSAPTYGDSYKTERYAFLWKTSSVKQVGKTWLEERYKKEIDREPFYATFNKAGKEFTLLNFHAVTQSKQPQNEVKYLKFLPPLYPKLNLIFCGDFNLPQSHTVFNPLKGMGYVPVLKNQKTSLKESCVKNECLASEFDNAFYHLQKVKMIRSGVVHFYKSFPSLKEARMISDHLPLYFEFQLK